MMLRNVWMASLLVPATLMTGGCRSLSTRQQTLTVSIAASLQPAMQDIQQRYQSRHPQVKIDYNVGASGTLQRQIEQGAPVDIFISADPDRIDDLADQQLVGSQQDLLTNQIVLVRPKASPHLHSWHDLQAPHVQRVALGYPYSVPAGRYGQEILTKLKLYEPLTPKFIFAKDVRQVLFYVETGNVDAGVVYQTDAMRSPSVNVVQIASAPSIRYPVAVLSRSRQLQVAQTFVRFLTSPEAQAIFSAHGFQFP